MNTPLRGRLLVVDDEAPLAEALSATLEPDGYSVTCVTSPHAALQTLIAGNEVDLLLTDLTMPEMDGIQLLEQARRIDPRLVGVVMTGHATIDSAVRAMQGGAVDYIQKPFDLKLVRAVIARALELRCLRLENAALQARERQHIAELESANRDLEAFSLSISHDLRAPVRTIRGYSEVLIADYRDSLPEAGRTLLETVAAGAARMDGLIDDLLTFCRFGRQAIVKRPVDCGRLVESVRANLKALQGDREIVWHVAPLPTCQADASLLEQVFVNLLSNAVKFTRGRTPAIIEVGCRQSNGELTILVRDNGAGFDMKHAGRLFGVFQRLHSQDEFEGSGVGLSIVQRIIERHGGQIWAESTRGEGATFSFTVPA